MRGDAGDGLDSRAAALNWDTAAPVAVLIGSPGDSTEAPRATGAEIAVLSGRHGDRLIMVVAAPDATRVRAAARVLLDRFGAGPVVLGPVGVGLHGAIRSARQGSAAFRAARAWPGAPRGIDAEALLPERALAGDDDARTTLIRSGYLPLSAADTPLLATLDAFLAGGRSLERAARDLFVHVNTVRYRLRRIADLTGLDPAEPRGAFALQLAVTLGRLSEPSGPPI